MLGLNKAETAAAIAAGDEVGSFIELALGGKTDLATYSKDEWDALCIAFAGAFMERCYPDMDEAK